VGVFERAGSWGHVAAAAAVVVALIGVRRVLEDRYAEAHPRYEAVVHLVEGEAIDPETIDAVGIVFRGQEIDLRYRREERGWRLARYRDAWARTDAVDGLVASIVRGIAIPVGGGRTRTDESLGFPGPAARISLYSGDRLVVETHYGGVLPGWNGRNGLYARRAGEERTWHLTTAPPSYLGRGTEAPAPMLDTRVLPGAVTPSGRLVRVRFEPVGSHHLDLVERRPLTPEEREARLDPEAPRHTWWGLTEGGERRLDTETADAYIRFLRGVSYRSIPRVSLLPPDSTRPADRRIVLEFEERLPKDSEGVEPVVERVTLEVRKIAPTGEGLVFCSATGLICELASPKSSLLFPAAGMLETAHPPGGSPFR
jgi:hypothetical protein